MYSKFYLYKGDVFKYRPESKDFFQMTGWDKRGNHDRRKLECEINTTKLKKIKSHIALAKINEYWDSGVRTWSFGGHKYDNSGCVENQPTHEFIHKYTNRNGEECSYSWEYWLTWHQGHLYWALAYTHYYPQLQLFRFTDINTEPDTHNFVKWTNAKHCRGIIDVKTKKAI